MDPQIKQLQIEMKKLGLYDGPIDGVEGPGTKAAIKVYERRKREDQTANAEQDAKLKREADDAAARRRREDEDAVAKRRSGEEADQRERDVETGKILAAATAGGLVTGLGGAKIADKFATPAAQAEMTARSAQLKNLAATLRAIDPTNQNARALYTDAVSAADVGRLTKRPLPWGTTPTGLGMLGFGAYSTFDRAPNAQSDVERALWKGTGYGEMTAGMKMLADSLRRYKNPGVAYPADDLAAVEGARRIARGEPITGIVPSASATPYEPAASAPAEVSTKPAPKPGSRRALYEEAKARGLPVNTKTKIGEIENILADAMKANAKKLASEATKAIVPLSVGAGVYDALRNPAAASDGSQPEPASVPEAAAAGTGAAAATSFGLQRLKDAIMGTRAGSIALRGLGRAAGPAGAALTAADAAGAVNQFMPEDRSDPTSNAASAMTIAPATALYAAQQQFGNALRSGAQMTADEVQRGYNWLKQHMPEALGGGGDAAPPDTAPAPAPGDQSYPISGPMQDAAGQDQQAVMDSLANLGASDPEIAQMIHDLIAARMQGAPAQ